MRSVYVYLKSAPLTDVSEWLTRNCVYQGIDSPWLVVKENDPVMYIRIEPGNEYMAFMAKHDCEDEIEAVVQAFGGPPSLVIIVDISGRHDGTSEVHDLMKGLLSTYDGYAQDDFSEHLWSYEQIADSSEYAGHPFFDFKGWYREDRKSQQ